MIADGPSPWGPWLCLLSFKVDFRLGSLESARENCNTRLKQESPHLQFDEQPPLQWAVMAHPAAAFHTLKLYRDCLRLAEHVGSKVLQPWRLVVHSVDLAIP